MARARCFFTVFSDTPHAFGGGAVTQPFQLHREEDPPGAFAQPIQQGVHCYQGFQDHHPGFRRIDSLFGASGQLGQIGLLHGAAAKPVDHQRVGDGAQVASRLANALGVAGVEHADESVLGQVRSIAGVAQAGAQPVLQPAVVFAVEGMQGSVFGSGHGGLER